MPSVGALLWIAGYALRMLAAAATGWALTLCEPVLGRRRATAAQLAVVRRLGLLRG